MSLILLFLIKILLKQEVQMLKLRVLDRRTVQVWQKCAISSFADVFPYVPHKWYTWKWNFCFWDIICRKSVLNFLRGTIHMYTFRYDDGFTATRRLRKEYRQTLLWRMYFAMIKYIIMSKRDHNHPQEPILHCSCLQRSEGA